MTRNTRHLHIGYVKAAAQQNTISTVYCNWKIK